MKLGDKVRVSCSETELDNSFGVIVSDAYDPNHPSIKGCTYGAVRKIYIEKFKDTFEVKEKYLRLIY